MNQIFGIVFIVLGLVVFLKPELVLFKNTEYEIVNKMSKYVEEYNKVIGGVLVGCGYYVYVSEEFESEISTGTQTSSSSSTSGKGSSRSSVKSSVESSVKTSELPDVKSSELFE